MADESNVNITEPENEGVSFAYVDEDGNEVQCRVLYFFHADHNNKDYMVYTTGVVSDQGEEVSAARFDPAAFEAMSRGEEVDVVLEPLTEEFEWAIVADTLKRLVPDGTEVDGSEVTAEDVDVMAAPEN